MRIAVCVKWVDLRPEVEPLTGEVRTDDRSSGFSAADRAAVETAMRWAGSHPGSSVVAVCVGPEAADRGLRELLAVGVDEAVRVDSDDADLDSSSVAAALASEVSDADWVLCGDHSADRGSGSVPAFLAHRLGAEQALGLVHVAQPREGTVGVTRRLGAGRSERLEVSAPAVLSVEGSVALLRRASLGAELASLGAAVTLRRGGAARSDRSGPPAGGGPAALTWEPPSPWRPRPRGIAAPAEPTALGRIVELTGAHVDRTPPRTVEASPEEAARVIVEQLRAWGYLAERD